MPILAGLGGEGEDGGSERAERVGAEAPVEDTGRDRDRDSQKEESRTRARFRGVAVSRLVGGWAGVQADERAQSYLC